MAGRRRDKFAQDFLRAQVRTPMLVMPPKPSVRMVTQPANRAFLEGVAKKSFRIPRLFGAIGS